MLKSISFKKLAVLTAGIAIVLSSCGLQNTAGESSGDATAAGKTKNFALANSYCYDSVDQWLNASQASYDAWQESGADEDRIYEFASVTEPHALPDNTWDWDFDWETWWAGLEDGVPCPVGTTFAESNDGSAVTGRDCYPQDYIDATVKGLTEQRDKPDASDAYKAEMQKGIDAVKGSCVKS